VHVRQAKKREHASVWSCSYSAPYLLVGGTSERRETQMRWNCVMSVPASFDENDYVMQNILIDNFMMDYDGVVALALRLAR